MIAHEIAKALGAKPAGEGWVARCPAHDDRTPSLSISVGAGGKPLLCCHAGCEQHRIIDALRARGLWHRPDASGFRRRKPQNIVSKPPKVGPQSFAGFPQIIWQATAPAPGTLVETYLSARGMTLPAATDIRFHKGLTHPTGTVHPVMVGLVTSGPDGAPMGIHRTFLSHDGRSKADVSPAKMMLGPCRGGALRLGTPEDVIMVGEGIETCLSAMKVTGWPAWAALSTSGLRALDLPALVRDVIILADGDKPGEEAAQHAARRWKREGRRVRIARPPQGQDFNDMLMSHLAAGMENFV